MLNNYNEKRAKTSNYRLKNPTNQYKNSQTNNFRDIYINQSPIYYNQYRYEQEEPHSYIEQVHYIQNPKKQGDYFNKEQNFQKTMKNLNLKPEYFFNEFNSVKDSSDVDKEKTFIQKSVNTFANQKINKLNDKFFFIENNKNIDKQKNEKKIYKHKEYEHQSYKGPKKPHLKERNLPIIQKNNYTEINLEENDNYLNTVAQKICNIIIKGEPKKDKNKKLKSGTKTKKNEKFMQNIEIEENVAQGSAIAKKKINFDINAMKAKHKILNISPPSMDYDENKEEKAIKEKSSYLEKRKKDEIKNFQKKSNEKAKFEKIDKNLREKKKSKLEEQGHEQDQEIIENEEEMENERREPYGRRKKIQKKNIEEEQEIEDGQIQEPEIEEEQEVEEPQEHFEEENIEQKEQIEQMQYDEELEDNNNLIKLNDINNEEGSNGINKGDIEELEEEEQQQIHVLYKLNNKRNKRIEYKLQKESEIKIDSIKEKKPLMKIEKFQINQKSNNTKFPQKKTSKLKIYYDDGVEIISDKKPLILEINYESNFELISKVKSPIIKIQKVQNFEQPRTFLKKNTKRKSLTIIKNRKNNVEILTKQNKEKEPVIKIQKAENFFQQSIKKKKARNKNIKFKINRIKDANFVIEKNEKESELIIENVQNYQVTKNKKIQIKKKKNIKLKINKIKDANFIIEKIENPPELIIENPQNYQIIKDNKIDKKKKNKNIKFKICKIKDSNFALEKIEEEPELLIENSHTYQIIKDNKKNQKKKNKYLRLKISKIKDTNFFIEKNEEEPELIVENTQNYQIIKNKKNQNKKKNKYTKNKISKNKDGDIEIIVAPRLCICNENVIEIKTKYNKKIYKKSNYKKLKQSKRTIYQYKSIQAVEDSISTPKDLRFFIKGKSKKYTKKGRNIIKKEITYFYKSPNYQKKADLSIGGKIKNTISPTYNYRYNNNELNNQSRFSNNNNIININTNVSNKRKLSSSSTNANNINQPSNLIDRKDEKSNNFKTTTIVSSNLIRNENEPIKKTYQSIRRKYGNSNSNKNILITQVEDNKSNILYLRENISKEKILKTDTSSNNIRKKQMINIISPIKSDRVYHKIEIKNDSDNNSVNLGNKNYNTKKYEPNRNALNQSDNNNIGKSKTYISNKNKNINNTKEIPKAPISKESNNNYNKFKNKSHTITIISNNQESKNIGRTYISSNRLNQSNEIIKKGDKYNSNSNIERIYINTSNLSKKDNEKIENKKMSSNSVNRIYITTNLKKDKIEDKNDKKDDKNELINNNNYNSQNNVYYSSSFRRKKSEPKQFIDNNKMFISSRGTSRDKKNFSSKYEEKTNINRVVINSYNNSPYALKEKDKEIENSGQYNLNKIIISPDSSINKDISNNNIETENNINNNNNIQKEINKEEQIITNTKTEEIIDNKEEKEEKEKEEKEDKEKSNLNMDNEIKKEENKSILDLYNNIGGSSQLSDITKSYLNSYMTGTRPELSDFSKQFLSSNYTSNSTSRPELSNLTRVYLISQSPVVENEDEK